MRLPLRLRVTLAFAACMAILLSALGAFVYVRVASDLTNAIDLDLRSRAQVLIGAVHARDPSLVRESHGSLIDPDEAFAQVLASDGAIVDASRGASGAPLIPSARLRSVTAPTFVTVPVPHDDPARLLAVPIANGYVVVGATLGDRAESLSRLLQAFVIGGPIALLLASLAGWFAAGIALRPVERMRREAEAISLAEPSRRLPVPETDDELARLGVTLNSMLDRLHHSLQREQRFLDEASHELRTPLSVLRMELDLALSRARTPEELQAALRSASSETDRLVRLAEDLLVLSREREGSLPLHRRETNVREILEHAASASPAIEVRCDHNLVALVDPDRIRQAVDDLVDNALLHGAEPVSLSAGRSNGSLLLEVRDRGPGYQRTADGLGLTIVRAITRAHGGELELTNDEGAVATLRLPLPLSSGVP